MDFQTRYAFNPKTDLLGKGGFSKVYKASDILLDRIVALKFFTGNNSEKYQVLNEIKKVIQFEHPNLCKYYDVAVLSNTNFMGETETIQVGIMEYLDAGDFKSYLKSNPQHTDKLLIDVLRGLAYLHRKGIVHRDLKPQNIIIKIVDDEPVAKITDFGISKLLSPDDDIASVLIGTIEYMSPEQFDPKKYGIGGRITTNLDLWSFGLLVYECLQNRPLFGSRSTGTSAEQVMRNILSDSYLARTETLPVKYQNIVKRCLVKHASERAQNAGELISLFNEEITSSGKTKIENRVDKSRSGLDNNSNTGEPIQAGIIKQTSVPEPELQELDDRSQGTEAEDDATVANQEDVQSTEVVFSLQNKEAEPGDDEVKNGAQAYEAKHEVADGDTRVVELSGEVSGKNSGVVQLTEKEALDDGTKVLNLDDNVTGDNTQLIQLREELFSESGQASDKDNPGVANGEETEMIQMEKVVNDGSTILRPGLEVQPHHTLSPVITKTDQNVVKNHDFSEQRKTPPLKKKRRRHLVLYFIIALASIIGIFVFRQMNATVKPAVLINSTAPEKTNATTKQPVLFAEPELIPVERGIFTMGYENSDATPPEIPAHTVNLNDFSIGKYEVTIEQFRQFINDTRYITTAETEGKSYIYKDGKWQSGLLVNWRFDMNGNLVDTSITNTPVVHVSWFDAKEYCKWLSGKKNKNYRLLTEAEWEYAARGGKNSKRFTYSGSNNLEEVAWFSGNAGDKIQLVGQKIPNELKLYDMSGNVMEWCNDWFKEDYYQVSPADNPTGPLSGIWRVVRGGSWNVGEKTWIRNSYRAGFHQRNGWSGGF